MKRALWVLTLLSLIGLSASQVWADGVNPDEPIEYIPYPLGNRIFPEITPAASYDSSSDSFNFQYDIFFQPNSEQPMFSVDFLTDLEESDYLGGEAKDGCRVFHFPKSLIHSSVPPSITIGTDNDLSFGPGTRLENSQFRCLGLPGVIESYTRGDVPPPSGQQVILPPEEPVTYYSSRTRVVTVGPVRRPDNLTISGYADYISGEADKAVDLGWINPDSTILSELDAIQSGQPEVSKVLEALSVLKAERGLTLTDNGYYLLKPNLDRMLAELGYIPPRETELVALKDTILEEGYPHANEGANPFLTVEEIRGRNSRSVIAFDLSEIDESSLVEATLVLTVSPHQQVTGWGNGGTLSTKPLTVDWVEGNGSSFGIVPKDAVSGQGSGTTWHSLLDPDISNSTSDGGESWNGGLGFSGQSTAPSLQITNHMTGDLSFDVTQDVLNGRSGWLILKDVENRGSKISFYSREGAVISGKPQLSPRLLLRYEGQQQSFLNWRDVSRLITILPMGSWNAFVSFFPKKYVTS